MKRILLLPFLVLLSIPIGASSSNFLWPDDTPKPVKTKARENKPALNQRTSELVDRIVVKKSERRLYLMRGDEPFRSYQIALGYQPTGHKQRQGDGRTPEGIYYLDWRNAGSNFRKALHISYPNSRDRIHAIRKGNDPGGMIMIHGQPNRRANPKDGDWTFGCIAVSNMAIDEIWSYTRVGIPIEILP